jgi:hypothetical protein
MGCRILHDGDQGLAALYCSTTDVSFGPIFFKTDDHDADEQAESFLRWLDLTEKWYDYQKHVSFEGTGRDPRILTESGLICAYHDWLAQNVWQWEQEDREADNAATREAQS